MSEEEINKIPSDKRALTFWINRELVKRWKVCLAEREVESQSAWLEEQIREYTK
jgi:hypothetical protein